MFKRCIIIMNHFGLVVCSLFDIRRSRCIVSIHLLKLINCVAFIQLYRLGRSFHFVALTRFVVQTQPPDSNLMLFLQLLAAHRYCHLVVVYSLSSSSSLFWVVVTEPATLNDSCLFLSRSIFTTQFSSNDFSVTFFTDSLSLSLS